MTLEIISRTTLEATLQRYVDGYGQRMRDALSKQEERDWQSMLFAAVDIKESILSTFPKSEKVDAD